MGRSRFLYTPDPLPPTPVGWKRGRHPVIFSFAGERGRYEVRQAAYRCFPIWFFPKGQAGTILRIATVTFVVDAFWLAEDYDVEPFDLEQRR